MRFKIDENLPVEIALRLRTAGHDATTVTEQNMVGDSDTTLSEACRREQMALVTLDLDFPDIRNYPPEQHSGFIVLRVAGRGKRHIMEVFERVVPMLETEVLAKQLWVVDEQSVRIRGESKERS
ncbi:MAG: DUF5615 family PIN-like protein [Planctomycetes bacterium]|nr:DUF5615 family PIN-like protein [Planctomycetota bacterium]